MRNEKIVLVDDNEAVVKALRIILSRVFKTVVAVSMPTLLPALLREGDVDVVLLDMNFGVGKQSGGEGLFWLERIREGGNPPAVVLITAFGDIELAVSALKKGAADFVVKPWDNDKLIAVLMAAADQRRLVQSETPLTPKEPSVQEDELPDAAHLPLLLLNFFLNKYAVMYGKPFPVLEKEAEQKLLLALGQATMQAFEQCVERAVLLSNSAMLTVSDFYLDELTGSFPLTLEAMEKQFITEVLKEKKGNLTLCAQQLEISRQTLYNKMKKYDL
ncbi:MAG: response regulator [Tannerellaceae bacterium]